MRAELGFDIEDLIAFGDLVVELATSHLEDLYESGREAFRELAGYLEESFDEEEARSQFLEIIRTVEDGLTEAVSFTSERVKERANVLDGSTVDSLLERLSSKVGSWDEGDYYWPLGDNPLAERPVLESMGRYVLPVPGLLLRECATLLEPDLLAGLRRFDRHRARALDSIAVRYICDVLPGARGYTNLTYTFYEGGMEKTAEVDGLIVFDRVAFVLEGKAGSLSASSLRGDVARLRSELSEIIVRAWEQGVRVRDKLLTDSGEVVFLQEDGKDVAIPCGEFDHVWVVNPTLHGLGILAVQIEVLEDLGLVSGTGYPWSVYINDLRIITDMVRNPAEFLHYLVWRSRLRLGKSVIPVDEIDLFGSYLNRTEVLELSQDRRIAHLHASVDFDAYYMGEEGSGPVSKKPSLFSVDVVDEFLERMSRRREPGWLGACGACIDLNLWELAFVDVYAKQIVEDLPAMEVRSMVEEGIGLVAMGTGRRWDEVEREIEEELSEARRIVVLTQDYLGRPRIAWASG